MMATILAVILASGCTDDTAEEPSTAPTESPSNDLVTESQAKDANLKINEMISNGDIQGLAASLTNGNKEIRIDAANALGQLLSGKGSIREDPALQLKMYGTITNNVDPVVESTVGALIQALNDTDPDVREEAAKALGEIGDSEAVDPLIQALKDTDPRVRASAVEALGKIGEKRKSVVQLRKALKDSDPEVKSNAEAALRAMNIDPYPVPVTGTYLIGERETADYEGYALTVRNPSPKDAIFELYKSAAKPYVAMFVRANDTGYIRSTILSPSDSLYMITGDAWDDDLNNFTKNVTRVRVYRGYAP